MSRSRQSRTTLPRVVIDLEKLRHINCGLGRFSLHLAQEMLKAAAGRFEPVFFLPKGAEQYFPEGDFGRIEVAGWKKEGVRRFARPFVQPFLPKPTIALWHATHQATKYLPFDARIPVLLTIHDLNFLHESPTAGRAWEITRKRNGVQRLVNRAAAIVTDSTYVAEEARGCLDLGKRPLHVVPLGLSAPPPPSVTRPASIPEGPFLLTVGNFLVHKNFHVLLEFVARVPATRLVIAGKNSTQYGRFIKAEIARLGLGDRVILPGEVSDGDRQWLYENCEAFFFPSLAEGFGFPVLEAMQCGKPVFMSRKTSLPEIAGSCGFFFDSFEAGEMVKVFVAGRERFLKDPALADACRLHANAFSWQVTAKRYADVYESVLRSVTLPRSAGADTPAFR